MGVSAICASATDLAFDLNGYVWQLVNCLFTAGYSLYLRGVMDKVCSNHMAESSSLQWKCTEPLSQIMLFIHLQVLVHVSSTIAKAKCIARAEELNC